MNRLGLGPEEVSQLLSAPERLHDVSVTTILSHLACGDTPDHPINAAQLASFTESRRRIEALTGPIRGSLANSPGRFWAVTITSISSARSSPLRRYTEFQKTQSDGTNC